MKKYFISLVSFFLLAISVCQAQRDSIVTFTGHAILENNIKVYTLIDKENKMKFILDSTRTQITAIDFKGKQLWRTDPWKDGRLEEYRAKRPKIVEFYFFSDRHSENKVQIWVVYNNAQAGFIDKL